MPVWYVDRHPMRVFKWTPEFNPFFETPIAVVWCNIIGLPIHLFEKSALYAIGGLLGTPIQIDHATATQTRLSIARIVEIDISKPPTEEFVLDIMGRETVHKVKWDKIPAYCRDCHHVGHVSSTCYAFGKREMPTRKNYHMTVRKERQGGSPPTRYGSEAHAGESSKTQSNHATVGTEEEDPHPKLIVPNRKIHQNTAARPEHTRNHHAKENIMEVDEEGFQRQSRRRGNKHNQKRHEHNIIPRSNSTGDLQRKMAKEHKVGNEADPISSLSPRSFAQVQNSTSFGGRLDEALVRFAKPSYYKQLENGEFDMEEMEDDLEMEEEPGPSQQDDARTLMICGENTHGTDDLAEIFGIEENGNGRPSASYSIQI